MAALSVRRLSDEEYAAMQAQAAAAGQSLEEWARDMLVRASTGPVIRARYAYRFYGPGEAHGTVRRLSDHPNGIGGGSGHCTVLQMQAVKKAQDLMRRNEAGDREKAYDLLRSAFEEVFEIPV